MRIIISHWDFPSGYAHWDRDRCTAGRTRILKFTPPSQPHSPKRFAPVVSTRTASESRPLSFQVGRREGSTAAPNAHSASDSERLECATRRPRFPAVATATVTATAERGGPTATVATATVATATVATATVATATVEKGPGSLEAAPRRHDAVVQPLQPHRRDAPHARLGFDRNESRESAQVYSQQAVAAAINGPLERASKARSSARTPRAAGVLAADRQQVLGGSGPYRPCLIAPTNPASEASWNKQSAGAAPKPERRSGPRHR